MSGAADLQAIATEAYRQHPYPDFVHTLTHPDRLATIARLAGMDPPAVATARILEIGVGTGTNTLAIAQSLPDAHVVGFDVEAEGIDRGRQRLAGAGLSNVELTVADVMDGAAAIAGRFDYIIAHGVLAWVPEAVGEALLALIGARLTPQGIAFVSFNALPGCYARQLVRDAALYAGRGVNDPAERVDHTRTLLRAMATPQDKDGPIRQGFRASVRERLEQSESVLRHDEFGPDYRPWYLRDMLDRAGGHGLKFLGDASAEDVLEAFVDAGEVAPEQRQAFVEHRACVTDFMAFRFFRRALLVRDEAVVPRVPMPAVIAGLYAASHADEVEPGAFRCSPARIQCDHPILADAIRRLIAAAPARMPVRDLGLSDELLPALIGLFDCGIVMLHTTEGVHAANIADMPRASPLARRIVAEGEAWAPTLDHRVEQLDGAAAAALAMLDGATPVDQAVAELAARGLDGRAALEVLRHEALLLR